MLMLKFKLMLQQQFVIYFILFPHLFPSYSHLSISSYIFHHSLITHSYSLTSLHNTSRIPCTIETTILSTESSLPTHLPPSCPFNLFIFMCFNHLLSSLFSPHPTHMHSAPPLRSRLIASVGWLHLFLLFDLFCVFASLRSRSLLRLSEPCPSSQLSSVIDPVNPCRACSLLILAQYSVRNTQLGQKLCTFLLHSP